VQEDEKKQIEAAVAELRGVLKGEDKDAITAKTEALAQSSAKLAERAYAKASPQGDAGAGAGPAGGASAPNDDVVDAEFTEVKDKK